MASGLALLALAALVLPAVGHDAFASGDHFFTDCEDTVSSSDWNYQVTAHTYVRPQNITSVYGARGRAGIVNLKACSSPNLNQNSGFSIVFAANIEGWRNGVQDGPFGHVQLGYGITNCASAPCENEMPDNKLRVLWTPSDQTPGYFEPADWALVPQAFQDLRFTIAASTGFQGAPTWYFEVKNMGSGETHWTSIPRTWTAGGHRAWSGAEIINATSQIHRQNGAAVQYIGNLRYQSQVGGVWTSYPNNGCHWAVFDDGAGHAAPSASWAICSWGTDGQGDPQINPYTKLHSSW